MANHSSGDIPPQADRPVGKHSTQMLLFLGTENRRTVWTDRDREIAAALMRSPLTAASLLRYSQTFQRPFTSNRLLRRRLQRLRDAGWVRCWPYASTSSASALYYKLTPTGYRMLNGPAAPMPRRSFFQPVSMALQQHTQYLADFIVATTVAAPHSHLSIADFYAENTLRLSLDGEQAKPDCAFRLETQDLSSFNYLVELDNSNEPLLSGKDRDSLARKVQFYDRYQDAIPARMRVLFLFSGSEARMHRFLGVVREITGHRERRLVLAAMLSDYLAAANQLSASVFYDRFGKRQALIPSKVAPRQRQFISKKVDQMLLVC